MIENNAVYWPVDDERDKAMDAMENQLQQLDRDMVDVLGESTLEEELMGDDVPYMLSNAKPGMPLSNDALFTTEQLVNRLDGMRHWMPSDAYSGTKADIEKGNRDAQYWLAYFQGMDAGHRITASNKESFSVAKLMALMDRTYKVVSSAESAVANSESCATKLMNAANDANKTLIGITSKLESLVFKVEETSTYVAEQVKPRSRHSSGFRPISQSSIHINSVEEEILIALTRLMEPNNANSILEYLKKDKKICDPILIMIRQCEDAAEFFHQLEMLGVQ